MKYVVLKNGEYYTDWIDSEDLALAEIDEYVEEGEGYHDEFTYREMTNDDLLEHYDVGDYSIDDLK